ncbi:hypothetical protein [Streptomyces scopuliridis]|uniref:hypothetical protein n=1 Tax=Streptomyces scopuliridis TaxID=452529 RepID=UPI0036CBF5A4
MNVTLTDLYTRYAARLAAHAADSLAAMDADADPVADTDDVTQEVWLLAAQLLVLPSREDAWLVLEGLANRVVTGHMEAEYRGREIPSGVEMPAARGLPPLPLVPKLPANTVVIDGATRTGRTSAPAPVELSRLAS